MCNTSWMLRRGSERYFLVFEIDTMPLMNDTFIRVLHFFHLRTALFSCDTMQCIMYSWEISFCFSLLRAHLWLNDMIQKLRYYKQDVRKISHCKWGRISGLKIKSLYSSLDLVTWTLHINLLHYLHWSITDVICRTYHSLTKDH